MGIDKAAGSQQHSLEQWTQFWPSSSKAQPIAWERLTEEMYMDSLSFQVSQCDDL